MFQWGRIKQAGWMESVCLFPPLPHSGKPWPRVLTSLRYREEACVMTRTWPLNSQALNNTDSISNHGSVTYECEPWANCFIYLSFHSSRPWEYPSARLSTLSFHVSAPIPLQISLSWPLILKCIPSNPPLLPVIYHTSLQFYITTWNPLVYLLSYLFTVFPTVKGLCLVQSYIPRRGEQSWPTVNPQ